ncbi:tRNA (adenosine(37)-N6)-threonylcarbamoyltransferase complex dimerization subunit type 1 TsaB [Mergibacter septicus]|uniref:tRNA (adenosine(37)-N6)-threonylcarbamoyltransferase complex dimerization subunit type 1 TsaB n=1 Tax=Mergibacter septicus TaxID=221402 RepID=UPI001C76B4DC|nr:tRNA (adenosine(37)-N6)-threonylcarbamoyltransferase complex dimerization subunit type 1 TsaB [Mergibacter septicus]QDJ12907.1 tRNA (adenosine(37)-N6)-threonylcarbamoyltransferase complex dimerization subunit type 1 TsaB [Mergibacter septicus]
MLLPQDLTLLALDTATEACSVALLHQGKITTYAEIAQRTHTQRILPMIDQILTEADIKINQINGLAFGRGPGSFTGVRVSAGIAQGLAFGCQNGNLPVYPISNLTAMAEAAYRQMGVKKVLCAIDARMNEIYFSVLERQEITTAPTPYANWQTIIEEQVLSPEQAIEQIQNTIKPEQLPEWVTVGTGWQAYPILTTINAQKSEVILPSAQDMLTLALTAIQQQQQITALEIEPIYLRNQVTWQKLPGRE